MAAMNEEQQEWLLRLQEESGLDQGSALVLAESLSDLAARHLALCTIDVTSGLSTQQRIAQEDIEAQVKALIKDVPGIKDAAFYYDIRGTTVGVQFASGANNSMTGLWKVAMADGAVTALSADPDFWRVNFDHAMAEWQHAQEWTEADSKLATSLGWDIFDADGEAQLQRIDCPEDGSDPIFDNDGLAAYMGVQSPAMRGDGLARKAIAHLIFKNSADVEKFGFALSDIKPGSNEFKVSLDTLTPNPFNVRAEGPAMRGPVEILFRTNGDASVGIPGEEARLVIDLSGFNPDDAKESMKFIRADIEKTLGEIWHGKVTSVVSEVLVMPEVQVVRPRDNDLTM